jgi:hemolysin activation/secretion protein
MNDSRAAKFSFACALIFAALMPLSVIGAPPAPAPGDREQMRERQERLIEEQRRRIEQLRQLPGQAAPETQTGQEVADERCADIKQIVVEGVQLMPVATQREIVASYEGQCLNTAKINAVLKDLTQWYLDRGYITTRAYLPDQTLSDGVLKVLVIEGKLEKIERSDNAPSDREINMAFPGAAGDVLNVRPLEQMLDQLGRLPSRSAKVDIVPGSEAGQSIVKVDGEKNKSWRIGIGADNAGQRSTGKEQVRVNVLWDSPLGLADQLYIAASNDVSNKYWQSSNSQSLFYSLPYGWWTFNYSYSRSEYKARAEVDGASAAILLATLGRDYYKTDGDSETQQLRAERILHRNAVSKTAASVGLSHMISRNYFEGESLASSGQNPRLSEFQLGVNHGRRIGSSYINFDLGWQRGVGLLGAQSRGHPHDGEPDSRYNKYSLTLSYLQPFALGAQNFSFESLAYGQYTRDPLFSLQKISLGGASSVRGFDEQIISGNTGGYWRNQVRWSKTPSWEAISPYVQGLSVALAFDAGFIKGNSRWGDPSSRLTSVALEFTAQGKYFTANLTVARALDKPSYISGGETPFHFNIGFMY